MTTSLRAYKKIRPVTINGITYLQEMERQRSLTLGELASGSLISGRLKKKSVIFFRVGTTLKFQNETKKKDQKDEAQKKTQCSFFLNATQNIKVSNVLHCHVSHKYIYWHSLTSTDGSGKNRTLKKHVPLIPHEKNKLVFVSLLSSFQTTVH